MAKKLLSVCAIAICSACGLEDLDSASKFISKTQENTGLVTGDKHRPGGAHANAYLINRVHVKDNDGLSEFPTVSENCPGNRLSETCNLTADVFVGYWWTLPDSPPEDCRCRSPAVWKVGTPLPSSCCILRLCISNAATEVETAIDKWLAPLHTPYGSATNLIVSNSNTSLIGTFTSGGKVKPDLVINFVCARAKAASSWTFPDSNNDDCPLADTGNSGKSCTRYDTSTDGMLASSTILPDPSDTDGARNIPIIYIGDDDIPTESHYDAVGHHDRLDLLHEIGHAFGLANTHREDKTKIGKQPRAIMARDRIFVRGNTSIVVGIRDDEIGVQWLYEHHHRGISTRNCSFSGQNTLTEDYPDAGLRCEPKYTI